MRVPKSLKALSLLFVPTVIVVTAACAGGAEVTATPGATTAGGVATSGNDGQPASGGAGTLEVRVTDAPNRAITAVYVTTSEIQVAGANESWVTVISEPVTFELLALSGVEAILGESELPAGRYTQVRLSVPEVEVTIDGESVQAEVPSDKLRLVGNFTIEGGEKTYISLDFDADASLVERGPNGYLFKPVIKMEVGEPGDEGEPTVELPGKSGDGRPGRPTLTP